MAIDDTCDLSSDPGVAIDGFATTPPGHRPRRMGRPAEPPAPFPWHARLRGRSRSRDSCGATFRWRRAAEDDGCGLAEPRGGGEAVAESGNSSSSIVPDGPPPRALCMTVLRTTRVGAHVS